MQGAGSLAPCTPAVLRQISFLATYCITLVLENYKNRFLRVRGSYSESREQHARGKARGVKEMHRKRKVDALWQKTLGMTHTALTG